MSVRITGITVDVADAVRDLNLYTAWVKRKTEALARRLAEYGLKRVEVGYNAALYDGTKHILLYVEQRSENEFAIIADGSTVLILEFGAGVRYGSGHPLAGQFGFGPGTYPNQKHAINPGYWYYTGEDGTGHHYSAGNAPSMVMYLTGMELEREVERIAREVFST